jgi:hypothetical protein
VIVPFAVPSLESATGIVLSYGVCALVSEPRQRRALANELAAPSQCSMNLPDKANCEEDANYGW